MTKDKFPSPKKWLTIEVCEVIYKAYKDSASEFKISSPMPDFGSRYNGVLESILGSVRLRASIQGLDLFSTSAFYFVSLAKSQAFLDANKRMSVIITDSFLRMNGYKLGVDKNILRDIAIIISKDDKADIEELATEILQVFIITPL